MSRDVPLGWEVSKLRDLATHVTDKWEPGDGQYQYLGLEHIDQGTGKILEVGSSEGLASLKTKFLRGDVLFGKLRPNLRKTALPDFDGIASTDIIALRAKRSVDPSFLFYTASSDPCMNHAVRSAAGTKMPRTSWALLGDYDVALPPVAEQRRIAEILASVDEAIQATQAVIEQTSKVKEGVLQRLLTKGIGHTRFKQTEIGEIPEGWSLATADQVCQRISVGIVIRPAQYYVPSGIKCFRSANVRAGCINNEDWVYISEQSNEILNKSKLQAGDVLVVRTGYPGTSCVVSDEYHGTNCVDIIFARPRKNVVNAHFLSAFINGPVGRSQVLRGEGGLAQKHFNVGEMKKMILPLPHISEQEAIAEKLLDLDRNEKLLNEQVEHLGRLKSALMADLLTGRTLVSASLSLAAE